MQHTLAVLNVSDNNLDSLEDFTYLTELQQFIAANNNLQKMKVSCRQTDTACPQSIHNYTI